MADGNYNSRGVAESNYDSTMYRDHEANVGGTINQYNDHDTFDHWRQAADFQDGDADDSDDTTDMRRGGAGQASVSGVLSQSDLAS